MAGCHSAGGGCDRPLAWPTYLRPAAMRRRDRGGTYGSRRPQLPRKAGGFPGARLDARATPSDGSRPTQLRMLHAALAHEDWQRLGSSAAMTAYSGLLIVTDSDSRRRKPSQLNWLAEGVVVASRLGTPATTAIVHPLEFTSGMMRAAQRNGATLQLGRVIGHREG